MPVPFQSVAANRWCTFFATVDSPTYDQRGAITFQTDGQAIISDGSTSGSVTLEDLTSAPAHQLTIAVVGPTGAVRSF